MFYLSVLNLPLRISLRCRRSFCVLTTLTIWSFLVNNPLNCQTVPNPPEAIVQDKSPFPSQLKKTVIFVQANCLHQPTPQELSAMPLEMQASWSAETIARLTSAELRKLPQDHLAGTGFIVTVPELRAGKHLEFNYLITNRHVVAPGTESGKPCRIVDYTLMLNRKGKKPGSISQMELVPIDNMDWQFPEDSSVDLAAIEFNASQVEWDFKSLPTDIFATQEMIDKGDIVEGDPVIFSGLFIQYYGQSRVEPVVRSGTLAMLPNELIPTTLQKPGHIYLADAHVFGGNSGSPMMVDTSKFTAQVGYSYKLLGVVSGEVFETKELTIQTTTTFKANDNANSDISMVVPAPEVLKLLSCKKFRDERDVVLREQSPLQP